jgi:hypothetical protein
LAAILVWVEYRGSDPFRCIFSTSNDSACDFLCQYMHHIAIIWFFRRLAATVTIEKAGSLRQRNDLQA